jgi:hypothetical protein
VSLHLGATPLWSMYQWVHLGLWMFYFKIVLCFLCTVVRPYNGGFHAIVRVLGWGSGWVWPCILGMSFTCKAITICKAKCQHYDEPKHMWATRWVGVGGTLCLQDRWKVLPLFEEAILLAHIRLETPNIALSKISPCTSSWHANL